MDSRAQFRRALDVAAILGALATIPLTVLQEHGVKSPALETVDWGGPVIADPKLVGAERTHCRP